MLGSALGSISLGQQKEVEVLHYEYLTPEFQIQGSALGAVTLGTQKEVFPLPSRPILPKPKPPKKTGGGGALNEPVYYVEVPERKQVFDFINTKKIYVSHEEHNINVKINYEELKVYAEPLLYNKNLYIKIKEINNDKGIE